MRRAFSSRAITAAVSRSGAISACPLPERAGKETEIAATAVESMITGTATHARPSAASSRSKAYPRSAMASSSRRT